MKRFIEFVLIALMVIGVALAVIGLLMVVGGLILGPETMV